MGIGMLELARDQAIRSYIPGCGIPTLLKDPKTKKVYCNPLKYYVKPFTLVTDPYEIVLAPKAKSPPIPMVIDNKGHFEVITSYFRSSQPEGFTVELGDGSTMRPIITNREVHIATIAAGEGGVTKFNTFDTTGSAGRGYRWPDSLWLNVDKENRVVFAVFRNLSSSANTIRFCLHGLRWYHTLAPSKLCDEINALYRQRARFIPFFYTTEKNVVLTAGETRDFDIRFTAGPFTEWLQMSRIRSGDFTMRLFEKTTGLNLFGGEDKDGNDLMIPDVDVFGNAEFPYHLREGTVYEPTAGITMRLTNQLAADNSIWITLGTRHIYV